MIFNVKYPVVLCVIVLLLLLLQVFLVRYNMKSNLWLAGTNKIVIQETITQKSRSFIIEDPNIIEGFKRYFENARVSYVYGAYARNYKITLINGKRKKIFGYTFRNHVTDFGKSPGSLTLIVRIYEMNSSFESFIASLINEKQFDFDSLQRTM